jgi:hypothetical protein
MAFQDGREDTRMGTEQNREKDKKAEKPKKKSAGRPRKKAPRPEQGGTAQTSKR